VGGKRNTLKRPTGGDSAGLSSAGGCEDGPYAYEKPTPRDNATDRGTDPIGAESSKRVCRRKKEKGPLAMS